MALSDAQIYIGDGATRDFSVLGEIPSESHLRVWINDVLQSTDDWDLLGSTVLFSAAPLSGTNVQFMVSTTGADFPSNPSAVGDVSININEILNVSQNMSSVLAVEGFKDNIVSVDGMKPSILSLHEDKAKLDSIYMDKIKLDSIYADKIKFDSIYADKTGLDSIYVNMNKVLEAEGNAFDALGFRDDALRIKSEMENSQNIVNAFTNIDFGGFSVLDGELIVDYFDNAYSVPSLIDGEFIITY